MKKLIILFLTILVVIYFFLSLLDMHGDYNAERRLWGINHDFIAMAKYGESTPDYAIERLARRYQNFIKEHPKSKLAARGQMLLGNLYMFKKDYNQARLEYQKVPLVYSEEKEVLAEAKSNLAKSYELQGDWDNALAVYKEIIRDYPLTTVGFTLPAYICRYYESKGLKANADAAYEEAALFYQNLAAKNPKSMIEYNALRAAATCRLAQKHWQQTAVIMGQLMNKYPTGEALKEAIRTINIICVVQLHDYYLAISMYKEFINKHPKHSAVPVIKKMISEFEILKRKGIRVNSQPE